MKKKYKINEEMLIEMVGIKNYINAKEISDDEILTIHEKEDYNYFSCMYSIEDEEGMHTTEFYIFNKQIRSKRCSCKEFAEEQKCKHLAAAIIKSMDITDKNNNLTINNYYTSLVNKFINPKEKEIIGLGISFIFDYDIIYVRLKIGSEKKYSVSNKLRTFFNAYESNNNEVVLGKYFTYDSTKHKFSKEDTNIIDFLLNEYDKSMYYDKSKGVVLDEKNLKIFLNIMGNKEYIIENNNEICRGMIESLPYKVYLEGKDSDLKFKFDMNSCTFLNDENTLVYYNNSICFIPKDFRDFTNNIIEEKIEEIKLDKKTAIKLTKKIGPTLKDNFIIEDKLKEEFEIIKPIPKMYFDCKSNIICMIKFKYNDKEIDYFSENLAFRNNELEDIVIGDLVNHGFAKQGKKFILENIDKMVEFIEKGIYILKDKYEIFTTENFESASILNKTNIKSQFSIGKDNILSYKFDLGEIDPSELKKIFTSMEEKVKYFKLKNGKILNTEDNNVKELKEIYDNLNIDEYNDQGVIPKYRSLYLDSVKNFNIVSTNNLFDEFIKNFNENKNSDISLDKKDSNLLRDYQYSGVQWLYNIYKSGFGGILADEMGLGKSIQTIMFLKNVLKEKPDSKILIVAPTSLIYNWENEFNLFGSSLKYTVLAANRKVREKIIETLEENIIITTYGLIRQDADIYEKINFELIIVDEAQNIKNPKAGISLALKKINSNTKIALTGTPIENSVVELWSIFDFLMPGYLNSLSHFQNKYNIKNMGEEARDILADLNKMINPFILRRRKKDVLLDLPNKIENNIYLDLLPEQKKYYVAQVKKSKEEFEKMIEEEGFLKARFKILTLLTKLRQICIDPKIVFKDFKDEAVKMVESINLIKNYVENNHKMLIFSSYKTTFELLKVKLEQEGITYYEINGSVSSKNRKMLVDAFNKDNTNVFLITLKAGGTGLNLTSADVVMHLDLWWNPQAENQATDRAHRIGQKNKVEVIKLICKGTIEERIIELQEKKKILNDTLIDNGDLSDAIIQKLDENDIKNLLSLSE